MIRAGRWCCVAGAGIGALGVLAWLLGIGALTAVIPGQPPMMPNTALGLLLLGVGGALRAPGGGRAAKTASVLAAVVVLAVGVGTLAEYLLAMDLGIDRALVFAHSGQHPGRPSPVTALALTALSSALIVFDAGSDGRIRPAECLVLLGGTVAFSALIGMAFGAGPLYRLVRMPTIGVAPPTVVALLLISLGMLLERPAAGVMSVVTSRGPGGVVVRRLIVPALVLPPLLGIAVTRIATAFGRRVARPPQGRQLPARRDQQRDPRGRTLAGIRSRHQRADAGSRGASQGPRASRAGARRRGVGHLGLERRVR
jgi:hypothetical protein